LFKYDWTTDQLTKEEGSVPEGSDYFQFIFNMNFGDQGTQTLDKQFFAVQKLSKEKEGKDISIYRMNNIQEPVKVIKVTNW
jgi:hypothetical protein